MSLTRDPAPPPKLTDKEIREALKTELYDDVVDLVLDAFDCLGLKVVRATAETTRIEMENS